MVERNGNGYKSLENWIWDTACSIRGAQEAAKYKDFILPLIFTKRLCDVFDDELNLTFDTNLLSLEPHLQDYELFTNCCTFKSQITANFGNAS
ncbi:N-6 DNA methylase [Richelia sinica FACHB-800]|uniref:N-6 DNA methylase n=1 Tax=Richelia sinica FACHB-800 TaxID=1357546 RepID=A0A975T9W0_9NOST|nr:type I restriction-modification system subunit M N-terminal domain-containing protein [Richelia sinica]QXE24817.1 N-6 DNA methylase [Richelia sinica FACHB-800]